MRRALLIRARAAAGRIRPTGRGWALIVAAVVFAVAAYTQQYAELLYPACLLGLLVVGSFLALLTLRPSLQVVRRFAPPVAAAGEPVQVRLGVRNTGARRSPASLARDGVPWLGGAGPRIRIPSLSRGDAVQIEYEVRPPRRGIVVLGPLLVEQTDPFGLFVSRAPTGEPDRLVVTPALSKLPEAGRVVSEADGDAAVLQRLATGGEDDLMTREYRAGDALRRVHWRASARAGELMVRQEEPRTRPDVRVVVETRQAAYRDVGASGEDDDSPGFEWMLKMLASLGVHLGETGFRVEVIETGQPQVAAPEAATLRAGRFESFLESLALAQPARTGTPQVSDAQGPVYAIVADSDLAVAGWIAHRRQHGERATAFVLSSAGRDVVAFFEESGWIVVPVRSDTDTALAWSEAARRFAHDAR